MASPATAQQAKGTVALGDRKDLDPQRVKRVHELGRTLDLERRESSEFFCEARRSDAFEANEVLSAEA